MKVRYLFQILALVTLSSCAGYHFNTNNNPLIGYDIRSVSVPMFVNRTAIADLAAPVTREIILVLNDYSGLKVLNGNNESADAVLIGILESEDYVKEAVRTGQKLFTEGEIEDSIGTREPFYYPAQTTYSFQLKIYLIKMASPQDIDFLTSDIGQYAKYNPRVVLVDTLDLSNNFYRVVGETKDSSSPGKTNFVKNKGIMEKSIQDTAVNAAKAFKQVVLNAF